MSNGIPRDSVLEKDPKVRALFDQLATELVSIRQTILNLYRASLNVYCPGWEKIAKSNPESLTKRALQMERSIKDSMVARGYNRRALTSYLYGAFEQVLVGLKNASHRPLSIPKRQEMVKKIAAGTPPEKAKKEVMDRHESKFVKISNFTFRELEPNEDMSDYVTELQTAISRTSRWSSGNRARAADTCRSCSCRRTCSLGEVELACNGASRRADD
jgi:hypothetical protein